jgi:hypothetical protein
MGVRLAETRLQSLAKDYFSLKANFMLQYFSTMSGKGVEFELTQTVEIPTPSRCLMLKDDWVFMRPKRVQIASLIRQVLRWEQ